MKVYAYIHPELNILCRTLLPEAVPEGVQAIEFEVESIDDIVFENGKIRVKTEQEKLEDLKKELLDLLKQVIQRRLSLTDYVIIKILEAQVSNDKQTVKNLKQKYAEQLMDRERLRKANEEIKKRIIEAKDKEELETLRFIIMNL